jgi:hypothetical protein
MAMATNHEEPSVRRGEKSGAGRFAGMDCKRVGGIHLEISVRGNAMGRLMREMRKRKRQK